MKRNITDEEFQNAVKQYIGNDEEKARELADALLVSLPTIRRWANGKNLPGQAMRGPIMLYIRICQTRK